MTIGIKVDFLWFSIGEDDFLHSFFSTICMNLENGKWGSEYPLIMRNLYSGKLSYSELEQAKKELNQISERLKKISPEKIVWDAENLDAMPPWGSDISEDIEDLSDYFITSDGKNLISVFNEAMHEAQVEKMDLEIKNL
ncbi:immunity 70 family protein [Listeria booriae]|uniref:immunity 70 family protein n=1 Tax=Listeria booriae TaxID=1552123 RepID=UPI00162905B4|nr:immunity 70 family protein [Listeria booriae]MBC2172777.1 hypothetical protein [Listeria booriae]